MNYAQMVLKENFTVYVKLHVLKDGLCQLIGLVPMRCPSTTSPQNYLEETQSNQWCASVVLDSLQQSKQ